MAWLYETSARNVMNELAKEIDEEFKEEMKEKEFDDFEFDEDFEAPYSYY